MGDGLPVPRIPKEFHGVRDDGLVGVDVSLASGRRYCVTEPTEARVVFVLDELINMSHLEQSTGEHIGQDLMLRHLPFRVSSTRKRCVLASFHGRIFSHVFPLKFPQLDDLDEVT